MSPSNLTVTPRNTFFNEGHGLQRRSNYDGYIFVIPTRYGRSVSQFSQFFDATGGLWAKQALAGKFATIMTSTGTQNGGQETTAFTTLYVFRSFQPPLVQQLNTFTFS